MSIKTEKTGNDTVTIQISGAFDFKLRTAFRHAYQNESAKSRFIIDFKEVSSIDSAAFGMLLTLREFSGGDTANITLTQCRPHIHEVFRFSKFYQLFKLR